MSYDNKGFRDAQEGTCLTELKSDKEYVEAMEFLIIWASHDWSRGYCQSFQIYNQDGEIVFNSEVKDN